ncbi:putative endonuclease [Elusimicrobium posterum]|uniref:GIY-YIG nuclease family protein n=1 Tax=Elusimicrobium posterum TaxID=3116653 RepID=UPI003C736318
MSEAYIYFLTNESNTVIYVGSTVDLRKRIFQHKNKFVESFSKKYHLTKLVYYEVLPTLEDAQLREFRLKRYVRRAKERLVNKNNPAWRDLYLTL